MKINRLFLYAAALVMAVSCAKEAPETPKTPANGNDDEEIVVPPASDYAVSFTAYTETPPAAEPQAKATIELNGNQRPQTFWEDEDKISVYSSANMSTSARSSYIFSTQLEKASASATFGYDGEDFEGGNYIAIYPHTDADRAVNFTAQELSRTTDSPQYNGTAYRIAQVSVPTTQTLVAGGFDRSAMVMTAYTENPSELHFKNAVALVKFNVADADVSSGAIIASGSVISGTFRADIKSDTGEPILVDYGQPVNDRVDFSTGEPLSTETDYYVAVRPDELNNGFKVYLNNVLVKSFTIEQLGSFERNKIYDLGTLTIPDVVSELNLCFDFTDASKMTGWPTKSTWEEYETSHQFTCPYEIDGTTYNFISSQPTGTLTNSYWPYFKEETGNNRVVIPNQRFLGLPVIKGYKLTEVSLNVVSGQESAFAIYNGVEGSTVCATQNGSKGSYTFNGLADAEQYWLKVGKKDAAISKITLTYTQITE